MVRESQHAESNADFIHKLSIALKDANEPDYWLLLLHRTEYIEDNIYNSLNNNIQELLKLLVSIIKFSKNKKNSSMENSQFSTNNSQFLICQTENGETKLDVRFQTSSQNITIHLKNIFEEGKLDEGATCKDFLQVQKEGNREVKRNQKYYNLDAIISVGYPIKLLVSNFVLVDSFALRNFLLGIASNQYATRYNRAAAERYNQAAAEHHTSKSLITIIYEITRN